MKQPVEIDLSEDAVYVCINGKFRRLDSPQFGNDQIIWKDSLILDVTQTKKLDRRDFDRRHEEK